MKHIYLSHYSALEAFRQFRIFNILIPFITDLKNMLLSKRHNTNQKIDILINNENEKSSCAHFKYHMKPKKLPPNSFINLDDKIHCPSGELITVLLAQKLCYEHLFLLVLELCGTFALNSKEKTFCQNLKPATTVASLKKYVTKYKALNPKAHGINNLQNIIDRAKPNSASPMESRVFVKLCGPKNRGCYNCADLDLNVKVKLSDEARKIAGQNYVIPDLSCVKKKVAIEYDSAIFHENSNQGQKDKRRRDALVHDG